MSCRTTAAWVHLLNRCSGRAVTSWIERLSLASLLITACGAVYMHVDRINAHLVASGARFTDIELPLDSQIPVVPVFVFAYFLYYLWILLPLLALREREHFYHTVVAFGVLQLAAVLTFILVPTYIDRPVILGDGAAERLLRWLYKTDQCSNLVPSLHVGHTVLVTMLFRSARSRWVPLITAGTLLISASTVLIKQHYLIDVPAGLLFALAAFYVTKPVAHYVRRSHGRPFQGALSALISPR
jgi:membrane-associated phospholipid phosphatase